MERLSFEDLEPWLLSGKPVVRLWGKDFDLPVPDYMTWLEGITEAVGLSLAKRRIVDPPGVVVCAYIGHRPEDLMLMDPMIKVTKATCPWLFCTTPRCRNRLAEGMPPGGTCEGHRA